MVSAPPEPSAPPISGVQPDRSGIHRIRTTAAATIVVILCFARPLYDLARFAIHSQLYSYILLIPFISAYLIWLNRCSGRLEAPSLIPANGRSRRQKAFVLSFISLGTLSLSIFLWLHHIGKPLDPQNSLALATFSFVCFLYALWMFTTPLSTLGRFTFPLAFLVFMIPLPRFVEDAIAYFLQHGSAETAYAMLKVSGMPVLKDGTAFQLPGFALQVAPECSGIHSTLVLFITSFLAGHLLLSNSWHRTLLVLVILPLALLRNGFRVFVLGQLCVRLDPNWINSDLHHRGGPIFFILSLIPFFALLLWLRKREKPIQHGWTQEN